VLAEADLLVDLFPMAGKIGSACTRWAFERLKRDARGS
jgi:hypothetical protein